MANFIIGRAVQTVRKEEYMLKLRSTPRSVVAVESFLEEVASKYRVNPDTYGNILVSLTEAVTNAIRHGNQCDEKKTVRIQLKKCKDSLAFRVSDEGCGFDHTNLPDPTCPEFIDQPGGRGVFLMRALCDEVSFLDNGSTVEMHFRI
jgi:serine/threonine-protein kinase RsbW